MATAEQKKNSTGNGNSAVAEVKDPQNLLPHLESLERIIKLPVVGAAWDKSQDVYGKVKGKNRVFNWALTAAEDCVSCAINTAAPIVCKLPIQLVDQTLVKGIDKLEVKAPIIKDTPQEIYNQAKSKVIDVVQPHIDRVTKFKTGGQQMASSLKDLAWQKANEVLATQYGSLAVNGVDTTTALAERLLEYYFPKSETDEEEDNVPVPASQDPVLHTVQTVGRLSNKIARRVYRNVSKKIYEVKKTSASEYAGALCAALKLHQYINFINSSMGSVVEQPSILSENNQAAATPSSSSPSPKPSKQTAPSAAAPPKPTSAATATTNKKPAVASAPPQ